MDRTLHVCMSGPRHAKKTSMLACIKECTTKCIATFEGRQSQNKQPSLKGHDVACTEGQGRREHLPVAHPRQSTVSAIYGLSGSTSAPLASVHSALTILK